MSVCQPQPAPAFTRPAIHIQTCCFLTKMWKPLSWPRGWLVAVSLPRWGPVRASRMTYIFIPSSADRVMTRDASLSPARQCTPQHGESSVWALFCLLLSHILLLPQIVSRMDKATFYMIFLEFCYSNYNLIPQKTSKRGISSLLISWGWGDISKPTLSFITIRPLIWFDL